MTEPPKTTRERVPSEIAAKVRDHNAGGLEGGTICSSILTGRSTPERESPVNHDNREYPPTPLMGVGALIVDNEKIVLVRRRKEPARGEWSIPGGLVKLGETLKTAVVREALEETGLKVEPKILVEVLERIFPDDQGRIRYHYVLVDYLCSVVGGALIAGSDAMDAAWVSRSELNWYALPTVTMRVILDALDRYPQQNPCHESNPGAVSCNP